MWALHGRLGKGPALWRRRCGPGGNDEMVKKTWVNGWARRQVGDNPAGTLEDFLCFEAENQDTKAALFKAPKIWFGSTPKPRPS